MDKLNLVRNIINDIKKNLEKKQDGSYSFKYDHESMIIHTEGLGKELDFNPIEELCNKFEEEIVSMIPNAVLIITDTLSVEVIISETNRILKDYRLMTKQVEFYDSIKTLFFPTMKENLVKIGNSKPKWLYSPSNARVEIRKNDDYYLIIKKGDSEIHRGIDDTAISFLKNDVKQYLEDFKFHNPYPKETILLPEEDITRKQLKAKYPSRKSFYISDYYSNEQKIKYIKEMIENFFELYRQFIFDNFFLLEINFIYLAFYHLKSLFTSK